MTPRAEEDQADGFRQTYGARPASGGPKYQLPMSLASTPVET
jgi:hypothetical protein